MTRKNITIPIGKSQVPESAVPKELTHTTPFNQHSEGDKMVLMHKEDFTQVPLVPTDAMTRE